MASIKIMLNDKEEIERLAADPDVKIKIKKAIVDEVLKRTAKAVNDEILGAIDQEVKSFVLPEHDNGVFDNSSWRCGPSLASAAREDIRAKIKTDVRRIITEELAAADPRQKIVEAMQRQLDRIEAIDIEKAVREAADRYVRAAMSRLGQTTGSAK